MLTDCHPSTIMINLGAIPPFSKLKIQKICWNFRPCLAQLQI
uniref:Uncharacterized protein n=1 Tax=Arundo donax TaxID=35708 RepID=A0A0A9GYI6_ARUDO